MKIHRLPSALRAWKDGDTTWVATEDALWRSGASDAVWPLAHVTELFSRGTEAIALTAGRRQRVGDGPSGALVRYGLDATAVWHDGWHIDGLPLPAGGRWARDLQPTLTGLGATWSTAGQAFRLDSRGLRATRTVAPAWRTPLPAQPAVDVATTHTPDWLWGPGQALWDLRTGESTPLQAWVDGVAASDGHTAVAVDSLDGEGLWLMGPAVAGTFQLPLRDDVVESASLEDGTAVFTTVRGRRFTVEGSDVTRLSGRHDVPEPAPVQVAGVAFDGAVTTHGRQWAWRRDGALVSSPAVLRP